MFFVPRQTHCHKNWTQGNIKLQPIRDFAETYIANIYSGELSWTGRGEKLFPDLYILGGVGGKWYIPSMMVIVVGGCCCVLCDNKRDGEEMQAARWSTWYGDVRIHEWGKFEWQEKYRSGNDWQKCSNKRLKVDGEIKISSCWAPSFCTQALELWWISLCDRGRLLNV